MIPRIRTIALGVLLLIPCAVRAEADIPVPCRMKNRPPGRCGWCALETLARHQHIESLFGLTDNHDCRCSPGDLEEALTEHGVGYRIQYPGTQDTAILDEAVHDGHGAAVGFRELQPGAGAHIVTLIDIGPDSVRVIDSNDQDGRTRIMDRDRFLYWWDGFALVLKSEAAPGAAEVPPSAAAQYGTGKTRPVTSPKPTR